MNDVQRAYQQIGEALQLLKAAKKNLWYVRNDQDVPLSIALGHIEQVQNVLLDPECTPEIKDQDEPIFEELDYDPNCDPYVWDGDRIEATKSMLLNEALANGALR